MSASSSSNTLEINSNNNANDNNDYEKALKLLSNQISKTKSTILKSSLDRKNTIKSMNTYLSQIGIDVHKDWNIPFIHITGSKGKGSTACITESILRNSYGYTTGLFTSPHLIDVNERIRINGKPINDDIFAKAYFEVRRRLLTHNKEEDLPTYFRMLTLISLFIFKHYQFDNSETSIDVVILEVGMGGRYDATNVLPKVISGSIPFACGVTMIDYEHTRILGETLELISNEKGGIFQHSLHYDNYYNNSTSFENNNQWKYFYTISTNNKQSVLNVLQKCGTERINILPGSNNNDIESSTLDILPEEKLHTVSIDDDDDKNDTTTTDDNNFGIPGNHQQINAKLAYNLSKSLHDQISSKEKNNNINSAAEQKQLISISKAIQKTFWPARCHTIQYNKNNKSNTKIYLHIDGAHTLSSINAYLSWLCTTHLNTTTTTTTTRSSSSLFPKPEVIILFNCSHEKNPTSILQTLQQTLLISNNYDLKAVYFCYADSERPSMISKPTTLELIKDIKSDNHYDSIVQEYDDSTWQNTLANVWKNILLHNYNKDYDSAIKYQQQQHGIITNVSVSEALEDISNKYDDNNDSSSEDNNNDNNMHLCITGSLYIAGSALKAAHWKEDHSNGNIMIS